MAIRACEACGRVYEESSLRRETTRPGSDASSKGIPGVAEQERVICPSCGGPFAIYLTTVDGRRVASKGVNVAELEAPAAPARTPARPR